MADIPLAKQHECRERMIVTLEHAGEPSAVGTRIITLLLFLLGAAMQQSGWKPRWFADADPETIKVAGDANGSLLEQLLSQTGYHDVACVELLRKGVCIISLPVRHQYCSLASGLMMTGELERSGVGTPVDASASAARCDSDALKVC